MVAGTEIADISVRVLSLPLQRPLETATFPIASINTVLTEVRTTDGHVGVGWSFALNVGHANSIAVLTRELATLALGHDALMAKKIWTAMSEAVRFIGRRGVAALAMSSIDTACWDIAGKAAGLPVFRLLGGSESRVKAYASQGLWLDRSDDELVEEAQSLVGQGFTAVKMRAGLRDSRAELARIAKVREAIGPAITLMVDVNQGWHFSQALEMIHQLKDLDLYWLEEPIPIERVADYSALRATSPIRICTGESNYLKDEIRTLLSARGADCIMPDLMRMGGVTEWNMAAGLCEAYGVEVSPHLFMEQSSHLAAACATAVYQEYMPWWDAIIEEPLTLQEGVIELRETPGFGISVADSAVRRYQVA
jgi:L-alanine-DL-glutamate epimerase-like enolase superfamily enzyme